MIVPVPFGASEIRGLGSVEGGRDTLSIFQLVSLETCQTEASSVRSLALVANCHTDLVGVEDPAVGAGNANLVVPVPFGASEIRGLGVVEVGEDA